MSKDRGLAANFTLCCITCVRGQRGGGTVVAAYLIKGSVGMGVCVFCSSKDKPARPERGGFFPMGKYLAYSGTHF